MLQLDKQIGHTYYKMQDSRWVNTATISNDLQFIVSGGSDDYLRIWKYQTNNLIKKIKLDTTVYSLKFTDDSKILYVGTRRTLYQLFVPNQFKKLYKQKLYDGFGVIIYCITNTTLLISMIVGILICQNITFRQQQFKLQPCCRFESFKFICGLDYNKNLNIIAKSYDDESIRLLSGNDGSLLIEKKKAHNGKTFVYIKQVLFLSNNQLISLDSSQQMLIWDINYQKKKLVQNYRLADQAYNMSLALDQYIITVGKSFIKIYTKNGKPFKQFDFNFEICGDFFNIVQQGSMKAVLIPSKSINQLKIRQIGYLCICKFNMG
ncbi:hypothetical protein pb186bvf_012325 [Paramecium bursaria]